MYKIIDFIDLVGLSTVLPKWNNFSNKNLKVADLYIEVYEQSLFKYGMEIFQAQFGTTVLKIDNILLSANENWTKATISLMDGKADGLTGALSACLMTHLSTRHALLVHASLIDHSGVGVLFIGPSNIGKTTQAELWQKYRSAIIINGDMAFVHNDSGKFFGVGCPFHGSSPYCENRRVELKGIVVLEKASVNTIEILDSFHKVERVMKNVFLPSWYEAGMNAALTTLDELLSEIPVYLLKCRPDEEAVELTEKMIFGKNV